MSSGPRLVPLTGDTQDRNSYHSLGALQSRGVEEILQKILM
ncbi:mCG1049722 [Mus musculus]|nr:mCG1049722 [Mus musculus]